jgi:hypothetical protein
MNAKASLFAVVCMLWFAPALAQTAVGGPNKKPPHYVGGATTQKNPVLPGHRESNPPVVVKPKTKG